MSKEKKKSIGKETKIEPKKDLPKLGEYDLFLEYKISLKNHEGEIISNTEGFATLSMILSAFLLHRATKSYNKALEDFILLPAKAEFQHFIDTLLREREEEEIESNSKEITVKSDIEDILEEGTNYADLDLEENESGDEEGGDTPGE